MLIIPLEKWALIALLIHMFSALDTTAVSAPASKYTFPTSGIMAQETLKSSILHSYFAFMNHSK